jgi:hypothetical protein
MNTVRTTEQQVAAEREGIRVTALASLAEAERYLRETKAATREVLRALLTDDYELIAEAASRLSSAAGTYEADDCAYRARILADDIEAL